jgi:hypothetical protein
LKKKKDAPWSGCCGVIVRKYLREGTDINIVFSA